MREKAPEVEARASLQGKRALREDMNVRSIKSRCSFKRHEDPSFLCPVYHDSPLRLGAGAVWRKRTEKGESMEVKMTVPHVLSAFAPETIGTKVIDPDRFLAILGGAIRGHDLSRDRVPGQHFIVLSEEAVNTVSCGVGRRTANPDDYVVRAHRGRVDAYLRRDLAAPAESLAVVVYTHDAYNADPQVAAEGRQVGDDVTHVIVAGPASAGPKRP